MAHVSRDGCVMEWRSGQILNESIAMGYVDDGLWTLLSFNEAIQYLKDRNVPTQSFEELSCFAGATSITVVDKTPQDIEANIRKRINDNLWSIFG